jgi:hypothetical protein
VRQLLVFQSRPVSRLLYTQLGVWARPLTRTSPPGGESSLVMKGRVLCVVTLSFNPSIVSGATQFERVPLLLFTPSEACVLFLGVRNSPAESKHSHPLGR